MYNISKIYQRIQSYIYIQLPETSFDLCDDDPDPFIASNSEDHGTAVAGEIVGARSNGQCGTGIAYNAQIGSEFNLTMHICFYKHAYVVQKKVFPSYS